MGSTTISRLARQSDLPTTGLNDGRVDHSGRFIWGGMDEATDKQPISAMYRLDATNRSRTIDAVHISNSICFSPDGTQMYFTDMPSGQILVYSDDTDLGVPHDPKIHADLSDQPGLANGSTIERPTTEAIPQVLRERGTEWTTVRQLTDAVNERGLYSKRDGTRVEVNQVHARTSNYGAMFEKDGRNIRLREASSMLTTHSQGVSVFFDDDAGFFSWLEENPDGYFINTERNPKPTYLVLHRPSCPHFDRSLSLQWTKDYVKICSSHRGELEEWATEIVGGEVALCRSCFV